MIRLLDVEDGVVKPTEHCQIIKWLKVIKEVFPDNYIDVYAYVFYMSCPSQENPYFHIPHDLREETVLHDLSSTIDTEADEVIEALDKATVLYETPTVKAYKAISGMLDNLSTYMENTPIKDGRDGNIAQIRAVAKDFNAIRESYKGVAKDLEAEQKTIVRGGGKRAYDQMD